MTFFSESYKLKKTTFNKNILQTYLFDWKQMAITNTYTVYSRILAIFSFVFFIVDSSKAASSD